MRTTTDRCSAGLVRLLTKNLHITFNRKCELTPNSRTLFFFQSTLRLITVEFYRLDNFQFIVYLFQFIFKFSVQFTSVLSCSLE